MKIASRKKKMPSIANSTPNTSPKRPVKAGQRSPNSKERTVPVTAPTANVTATAFDQRCASFNASASSWRRPRKFAISIIAGSATPSDARMMWNPSVNAIWLRAAPRLEARVSVAAAPLGLDPNPARALMREARAGPVDDGFRAILVGGQQGEVDGAPGELGLLALDRLAAEHLHHGRAAADRRHRAFVLVGERLRLLAGDQVRDRLARVLTGLQRHRAELGQDLLGLRVGDRGDVADREGLRM